MTAEVARDTSDTSRHVVGTGAAVLDRAEAFIRRFVVLPSEHAHVAVVLWVAHAHTFRSFDSTPRLAFMSPEKGCGKSRAQEVVESLVPRPLRTSSVTPAVLYRLIGGEEPPVVLLDEVDTIWTGRGVNEELRAVVNAGHRPGNGVGRIEKDASGGMRAHTFDTFAPVCLAGIGALPSTVADRSVVITMKRRLASETVEPWRFRTSRPEGHLLGDALARWVASVPQPWEYPSPEEAVTDRAWDVWEPLVAIAENAGSSWPQRARAACLALSAVNADYAPPSAGLRLLSDLREVWPAGEPFARSATLCESLNRLPGAPWGRDEGLSARRLANLLRPYGVQPQQRQGREARGYIRSHLMDPWARYLPLEVSRSVGSVAPESTMAEAVALVRDRLGAVEIEETA